MKLDLCKLFGVEEGEEFKLEGRTEIYRIIKNRLYRKSKLDCGFIESCLMINEVIEQTVIKLPKKKQFTDDELCILSNIDKKLKLVARDKNGHLYAYPFKPTKGVTFWGKGSHESLFMFKHLFQSIQWEDEEPVFIDDYVER